MHPLMITPTPAPTGPGVTQTYTPVAETTAQELNRHLTMATNRLNHRAAHVTALGNWVTTRAALATSVGKGVSCPLSEIQQTLSDFLYADEALRFNAQSWV